MTTQRAKLPRRAWGVFYGGIAACYLLTASGRVGGMDGLAMFNVTQSLATNVSMSAEPCTPASNANHCVQGIDGKHYAAFGLVPSIASVPAYFVGIVSARLFHLAPQILAEFCVSLNSALLAAAVPVFLALWLCRIGLSAQAALWSGLAYAFATPAWIFSKAFYSEPYFALGLITCCYFLSDRDGWISLLAAGACFGCALGSRAYGVILTPVIALYALMLWNSRHANMSRMLRNLLIFGAPIALAVGLIALSNQLRFGSILKTGYHLIFPTTAALFSTPLLEGMTKLLINREAGTLVFVPWVAIVPFLWKRFWVRYQAEAILVLGMSLTNYVFFAKYTAWQGGWSLGPRMLYAIFPFLILPLAVLWEQKRSTARRIASLLVSLTLLIQCILIPYPTSRYFTMQVYNQEHQVHSWWSDNPLLEATAALPELLFGRGYQENDPAHQFLLKFPNSINQVRADIWLLKAPSMDIPTVVICLSAGLLVLLAVLSLGAVLRSLRTVERAHQAARPMRAAEHAT